MHCSKYIVIHSLTLTLLLLVTLNQIFIQILRSVRGFLTVRDLLIRTEALVSEVLGAVSVTVPALWEGFAFQAQTVHLWWQFLACTNACMRACVCTAVYVCVRVSVCPKDRHLQLTSLTDMTCTSVPSACAFSAVLVSGEGRGGIQITWRTAPHLCWLLNTLEDCEV